MAIDKASTVVSCVQLCAVVWSDVGVQELLRGDLP